MYDALRRARIQQKAKVVLLAGAAAAIKGALMGVGGASAHLFAREAAKAVLTDIRDEFGERAVAELYAQRHGARYMRVWATSVQGWAKVIDAVMAAQGRLCILFDNVGPPVAVGSAR